VRRAMSEACAWLLAVLAVVVLLIAVLLAKYG
jgi:hypothetical protein